MMIKVRIAGIILLVLGLVGLGFVLFARPANSQPPKPFTATTTYKYEVAIHAKERTYNINRVDSSPSRVIDKLRGITTSYIEFEFGKQTTVWIPIESVLRIEIKNVGIAGETPPLVPNPFKPRPKPITN